jgi:hypothetical protein
MEGVVIKVHINFKKRIERFIQEFEKKHRIKLSFCKATKLIDEKIEEAGGLVV